jgi:hypothetical protein
MPMQSITTTAPSVRPHQPGTGTVEAPSDQRACRAPTRRAPVPPDLAPAVRRLGTPHRPAHASSPSASMPAEGSILFTLASRLPLGPGWRSALGVTAANASCSSQNPSLSLAIAQPRHAPVQGRGLSGSALLCGVLGCDLAGKDLPVLWHARAPPLGARSVT